MAILIFGIILTLVACGILIYSKKRYEEYVYNKELNVSLIKDNQALAQESNTIKAVIDSDKLLLESLISKQNAAAKEYQYWQTRSDDLETSIQKQEQYIATAEANLEATLIKLKTEKQAAFDKEIAEAKAKKDAEIAYQELATKTKIEELKAQLALEEEKVLATIATVQALQTDEEKDLERKILITSEEQEDIGYLLNNVASRLKHPDVLYKLIWQEYIQKPTNNMLDNILPEKECSGIYKITNLNNKKSYIGRSTNVRRRITDHIKSTIGISTIADQHVHKVMREEGLWNFKFELVEACDKGLLGEREKYYIEFFKCQNWGYNAVSGSAFKGE